MPGHLILVRPHTSLLDGPAVARYLQYVGGHYGYLFAVDPDYARHPAFSRVLRWYGWATGGHRMVALDQRSPMGLRLILREMEGNGRVVLFPQGTGIGDAKRPDLPGAEWVIRKTQCRVTELVLLHRRWRWPVVRLGVMFYS